MVFKTTEWEFSNEVDCREIDPETGVQFLQILDASCNKEKGIYTITFQSLTNNAIFDINYWLYARDEGGAEIPNAKQRGTLISLGKALAGVPIGIPNPVDIKGGVVSADVVYSNPTPDGKTYPRIYRYSPVPEDIAICATIEQYYLPSN